MSIIGYLFLEELAPLKAVPEGVVSPRLGHVLLKNQRDEIILCNCFSDLPIPEKQGQMVKITHKGQNINVEHISRDIK